MFWIYLNKGLAVLHRGGCEDCNYGTGKSGGMKQMENWLGPFEAAEDAKTPDGTPTKVCKKCRPDQDW